MTMLLMRLENRCFQARCGFFRHAAEVIPHKKSAPLNRRRFFTLTGLPRLACWPSELLDIVLRGGQDFLDPGELRRVQLVVTQPLDQSGTQRM